MNHFFLSAILTLVPVAVAAQQVGDESFRFDNPAPAFAAGEGPQVCIDEAHYNFHTAEGRYKPFAELLRGDGYTVTRFTDLFTEETLADCRLLVVANALAERTRATGATPIRRHSPRTKCVR